MRPIRSFAAAACAAALMLSLPVIGAGSAGAASYRYWTYWTATASGWTFAQVGPASRVPADGSVEGWRFAVSAAARSESAQPRIAPAQAFQQFCGSTPATSGHKRVAVVFDFGTAGDAPPGQVPPQPRGTCSVVPKDASGGQVLSQVADLRLDSGLVCAIGGYPAGECAPAVADPMPSPTPSRDRDGSHDSSPPDRGGGGGSDGTGGSGGSDDSGGTRGSDGTGSQGSADPSPDEQPTGGDRPTGSGNGSAKPGNASDDGSRSATPTVSAAPHPSASAPDAAEESSVPATAFVDGEAFVAETDRSWLGWAVAGLAVVGLAALLLTRRRTRNR